MRKKLLMLTVGLGLTIAASSNAFPTILCDSCTSTSASVACRCAANSRHPNVLANCSINNSYCWGGFPH